VRSPATEALRALAAAFMAASTVASGGCYRYQPIDNTSSALGTEVRLRLTDAGAITLAPLVGNRIELVDGRLSSVVDTAVTLSVTNTTDRLGVDVPWKGEQVMFPKATVASLERKSLDRGKSYVVGAIAAGIIVAIGVGFSITGGGGGKSSGGTGSPR
jgi:hypothetical protein